MTDWNKEAELRVQYINWLVDSEKLPCFRIIRIDLKVIPNVMNPETIMRLYMQTGWMYVKSIDSLYPEQWKRPTYEQWLNINYPHLRSNRPVCLIL